MAQTGLAALRAVVGVLEQKVRVLEACREGYTSVCPRVGASVGMHMRHSLDHIDRAAKACEELRGDPTRAVVLSYDKRVRGSEV